MSAMARFSDYGELMASAATILSAMGCALCFPALGGLAASIGLGFLSAYEGVLITKVLPVVAALALALAGFGWWQHRVHWRGLLSSVGPLIVLAALYPLWQLDWSNAVFYVGLIWMLLVSLFDFFKPPRSVTCRTL